MKAWKEELLTAYENKAKELKEISLYDVAKQLGYNHIKRQDMEDIVTAFCKKHPEYKPVIMLNYKGQNASLFSHGILTMNEYDDSKEFAIVSETEADPAVWIDGKVYNLISYTGKYWNAVDENGKDYHLFPKVTEDGDGFFLSDIIGFDVVEVRDRQHILSRAKTSADWLFK